MATIATRRERVVLDLETNFPREAAEAAAAIRLLNEEINHLGGKGSNRSALKTVSKDMEDVGRSANRAAPSIDKYSGRIGLLAKSLAAVGPGVIPISAVAIPAITGLASSMGFAAIAGGTMIGAFQGVGDALKALNKAHLEPTKANIDAARLAMAQISPEARKFTHELSSLEPALKGLRDQAATGLFPGLTEGLDQMKTALPAIQRIVGAVSGELGDLAAAGGKSLAGPQWAAFFDFLANEAPQALADMSHGVGNVAHAMAELWMAFAPVNRSFSSWLVDSTADLDKWASGLSKTQGFADFVNYIQTAGPQVGATLGAVANALLQIVQAAAPIGGPVLKVIEALANAIASIADSDIGTPLFGMVAALSALNLAMSAGRGIQGKFAATQGQLTKGFEKQRTTLRALAADYAAIQRNNKSPQMVFAAGKDGTQQISAVANETERFNRTLRETAVQAGKAGALVGAFALESTGAADGLGLTNTVSLALAGTLAGPYGAAIGAAVGAALDLAHANDELSDAMTAAQSAMDSGSVDAMASAYDRLAAAMAKTPSTSQGFGASLKQDLTKPGAFLQSAFNDFSGKSGDAEAQLANLGKAAKGSTGGVDGLLHSLGALPAKYSLAGLAALAASKALAASRSAARETAQSFTGLGKNLSNAKVGLNGWTHQMEQMAASLRQFTANSLVAANKGLRQGLVKELQKAGPEGALRMKQLADGTEKQIHRANQAWLSQRAAVKSYTDAVGGVPGSKSTKVAAPGALQAKAQIKAMRDEIGRLKDKTVHADEKGAAAAKARVAALRAAIASLRDRTVTITTVRNTRGGSAPGGGVANQPGVGADGATVPKTGLPYADRHLYLVADGERIVSNRYGQVDANRELLDAINNSRGPLRGFADGGTAGSRRRHHPNRHNGNDPTPHVNHFAQALKAATASINKEKAARDALISKRNDLRSTVSGNFMSDPFAGGNVWAAGGGNPTGILKADIVKANAFKSTLYHLKKAGLSGDALASIAATGDIGQAQALLAGGKSGVGQFESAFNQRAKAAAAVGSYAGSAAYGAAIARDNKELKTLNATVHRLEVQLKHRHAQSQKNHKANADHTAKGVAKGVNSAASKAKRRNR